VIRCSHCGKLAPAGALSCQSCGMPLANSNVTSAGPSEQQELPAWLESLRAHERPLASGQGDRQPFSMDELVDEDSMPHWMRRNRSKVSESGNSDTFPALSTNAQSGAGPEEQAFPASGLAAGSLIDEQSLPSWMRTPQEGAQPTAGQGLAAHSLVDQQALPPWIKELSQSGEMQAVPPMPTPSARLGEQQYGLPPQAPVTPPAISRVAPVPQTPPAQSYTPGQSFSAGDLIDQRSLPDWMKGAQGPGQQPQSKPVPTGPGFSAGDLIDQRSLPDWMKGAQGPGQQPQSRPVPTGPGFSAGDLIDQRSLPKWMQEQQGQEKADPISARGVPVNGSGQMMGMGQGTAGAEGMPASTLLDMDSLPSWMREGEQGSGLGMSAPGGMSAGSLIDKSALPQWMREGEEGQLGVGGAQSASASGYTRSDGIRVPGRPRAEVNVQEQSEAAANVFSSMLGVSASTPVMPGQASASNLGVVQGQQVVPPQVSPPVMPGWQAPASSPTGQGMQAQEWRSSGRMPSAGVSSMASPTYTPGGQAGVQAPAQRGEPQPYAGFTPNDRAALAPGIGSTSSGNAQVSDTKKKGFFDAIREFFFK